MRLSLHLRAAPTFRVPYQALSADHPFLLCVWLSRLTLWLFSHEPLQDGLHVAVSVLVLTFCAIEAHLAASR